MAHIEGQFFGYAAIPLLVEQTIPGGNVKVVDTMRTDDEGFFSFDLDFEDENPIFINIRTIDNYVPLLVAPGEDINISSIGNIYNNYTVSGSKGSLTLRSLNMETVEHIRALDSISTLFNSTTGQSRSKELSIEYAKKRIDLKRMVIRFVITNPTSMVSIVPLYQPMVAGRYIFDEPTDIVYFRAVADSLAKYYPTSPYVVSLLADIEQSNRAVEMDSTFQAKLDNIVQSSLPPLELKDAEGQMRKLSDLIGKKVVLLDFTTILAAQGKVRNREIAEIYDKYSPLGFEIYQVSVDENRAAWLSAIVDARLKWISVNDFTGVNSKALSAFNVSKIPSNFLINKEGDIVATDILSPAELEKAIAKLL